MYVFPVGPNKMVHTVQDLTTKRKDKITFVYYLTPQVAAE